MGHGSRCCSSLPSLPHCPSLHLPLGSYGPGPEHGGDHEHEALTSVQLAGGTPLPATGAAAKAERAGLISVGANASSQRPAGW